MDRTAAPARKARAHDRQRIGFGRAGDRTGGDLTAGLSQQGGMQALGRLRRGRGAVLRGKGAGGMAEPPRGGISPGRG